jgi:hypothetical protein
MPCMNWKFIVPVLAVGLAVAAFVPGAAAAVVPLLVLAICPLAMVVGLALIARTGNNTGGTTDNTGETTDEAAELRAEVARLRGERTVDAGTGR